LVGPSSFKSFFFLNWQKGLNNNFGCTKTSICVRWIVSSDVGKNKDRCRMLTQSK
jgi:hypothetical protein